jgi:hypothetical protein
MLKPAPIRRVLRPLLLLVALLAGSCTVAGGVLIGSCAWIDSRALGRARRTADAIPKGMPESDALTVAKAVADSVEVFDGRKGWRARRIVASFQRLDGAYYVVACLDDSGRVTETAPPAEYPDACFVQTQDPA